MDGQLHNSRRNFIQRAAFAGTGIVLLGQAHAANAQAHEEHEEHGEEEISPAEDLMREHGVLKRILLIYGEAARRISVNEDLPPEALKESATIIRTFIEDYHGKLEEDFLFPRFRKADKLVDLVDVLLEQHQAGRKLTDTTLHLATLDALKNAGDRATLRDALEQFVRMYNVHEAREDTVLFPAFRGIVSAHEYFALGEEFEEKEHELFGEDGFAATVDRVAAIEKSLDIYDLAQFTAKL